MSSKDFDFIVEKAQGLYEDEIIRMKNDDSDESNCSLENSPGVFTKKTYIIEWGNNRIAIASYSSTENTIDNSISYHVTKAHKFLDKIDMNVNDPNLNQYSKSFTTLRAPGFALDMKKSSLFKNRKLKKEI